MTLTTADIDACPRPTVKDLLNLPDMVGQYNWQAVHTMLDDTIPSLALITKEVRHNGLNKPDEIELEYYITSGDNKEFKDWLAGAGRQLSIIMYSSTGKPVVYHEFTLGDCKVTGVLNLNAAEVLEPTTVVLQFKVLKSKLFNFL